ncbi:MAG: hypothetical protein L0271_02980 [Gemmatimonadetes bacterium]|nr:hypothetical protein [Gemmatimonadota bacterium]
MHLRRLLGAGCVALLLPACDAMGPEGGGRIDIRFTTTAATSGATLGVHASTDELVIAGSNGTLTITQIALIVSEFELEREEDACESSRELDDDEDDECEEFKAGPFFVDLPLDGAVSVVSQEVPAGSYTELEFEVEDLELDDDEDDDDDGRGTADVLARIRAAGFDDWPEKASMVVVGTFTPVAGAPRPFTTFFEAEIEIEMDLQPPLIVAEDALTVDVEIVPAMWFRTFANSVVDLSAFDFATTGKILEFEAKLENGFQRIEFDR